MKVAKIQKIVHVGVSSCYEEGSTFANDHWINPGILHGTYRSDTRTQWYMRMCDLQRSTVEWARVLHYHHVVPGERMRSKNYVVVRKG